jgi:hypothetical protein
MKPEQNSDGTPGIHFRPDERLVARLGLRSYLRLPPAIEKGWDFIDRHLAIGLLGGAALMQRLQRQHDEKPEVRHAWRASSRLSESTEGGTIVPYPEAEVAVEAVKRVANADDEIYPRSPNKARTAVNRAQAMLSELEAHQEPQQSLEQ